ncbi:hypothetical protein SY2F82_35780 [Streptomyces sp. Y2F8-2]|nr:hypothetical protein SY2F82_35780 [Streptomyces sp. Y2F8-2]
MSIAPILSLQGVSCAVSAPPDQRGAERTTAVRRDRAGRRVLFVIGRGPLADGSYNREALRRLGASIDADETAMIVPREVVLHAAKQLVAEGSSGRWAASGRRRCARRAAESRMRSRESD